MHESIVKAREMLQRLEENERRERFERQQAPQPARDPNDDALLRWERNMPKPERRNDDELLRQDIERLRGEVAELRAEVRDLQHATIEFADEAGGEVGKLEKELRGEIAELRSRLDAVAKPRGAA
jgi:hypothetical protein